jgi:hypothetical protein
VPNLRTVHHRLNKEALPCSRTIQFELGVRESNVNLPRTRRLYLIVLSVCAATAAANPARHRHEDTAACALDRVHEHVREQFARFGPQSAHREYFGFVYLFDGRVASAVARGNACRSDDHCITRIDRAARAIPRGAKLLGEWHTHPTSSGSRALSADDVRGARHYRHIPCYQAYYSTPRGEIYTWNVTQTSVTSAMATRVHLGNLSDTPRLPDQLRLARTASW